MDDDYALKIEGLHKDFVIPHERRNSLKEKALNILRPSSHERFHALRGIDIEVKKGEFFGVVGRNGSGKSTLLKLIAGIYQPTQGSITVNGELTPFIELGIGFNPELSGRENVYLNGAILGLTRKEVEAKYDEIVSFAELEKFMDTKLKNYSSGMQVRLAFSIAMQAHNEILLIDEVLAVGDADFQRKCFRKFKEIKQSTKTVIFISHDMGAIKEYCDRAVMIEDGKIVSSGDPDVVANDYIQLFNVEAQQQERQKNRWGDRSLEISDIDLKVGKKIITVSYKLTAKKTVEEPIPGLIIKDLDNHHIFDTNTKWKKVPTGSFDAKSSKVIEFKIPNVLKSERYTLTCAVGHADGLGVHDWQEKALTFDVSRPEETAGLVVLDDIIQIKE